MAGNGGKRLRAGRPKGAKNKKTLEIEALAREHAPAAMEKLVALVDNPKHPAHFSAIKEILDRGYGKPKQAHEHSGKDGAAIPFAVSVTIGPQPPHSSKAGRGPTD